MLIQNPLKTFFYYVIPFITLGTAAYAMVSAVEVTQNNLFVLFVAGAIALILMIVTIMSSLYHAEVVAHRIGQPWGSIVLTLAVTTIEVSVIVALMSDGQEHPTLARETVFGTVMLVCTGVVGLCLFLGGLRHGKLDFNVQGANAYLSVLIALAVLTLVLPNFVIGGSVGEFSPVQFVFIAGLSFLLYCCFLYAQTFRHQDDFIDDRATAIDAEEHITSKRSTPVHLFFLVAALAGFVLLTEEIADWIQGNLPETETFPIDAVIGTLIAMVIVLPEAISAIKASLNHELQRGINITLGSAAATIGLTVPIVSLYALISGHKIILGLNHGDTVQLILALMISVVSFSTGKTTMLNGMVHLVLFVAFLVLVVIP